MGSVFKCIWRRKLQDTKKNSPFQRGRAPRRNFFGCCLNSTRSHRLPRESGNVRLVAQQTCPGCPRDEHFCVLKLPTKPPLNLPRTFGGKFNADQKRTENRPKTERKRTENGPKTDPKWLATCVLGILGEICGVHFLSVFGPFSLRFWSVFCPFLVRSGSVISPPNFRHQRSLPLKRHNHRPRSSAKMGLGAFLWFGGYLKAVFAPFRKNYGKKSASKEGPENGLCFFRWAKSRVACFSGRGKTCKKNGSKTGRIMGVCCG